MIFYKGAKRRQNGRISRKSRNRSSRIAPFLFPIILVSCSSNNCQQNSSSNSLTKTPHVVVLLDKSASMEFLVDDVLMGFNRLVGQLPDTSYVTLFGFESIDGLQTIFSHESVISLPQLTRNEYQLGDGTPLYDAISKTIIYIENNAVNQIDEKVLFVIISDGLENSSISYDLNETRDLVNQEKQKGWDIRFFGLGSDAATEASNLGIPVADSLTFSPNQQGVEDVFDNIAGSFATTKPKCERFIP